MSIAVLHQVYDEMRRLAIAGSVVAGGDFRLKKLVPPLEQAGAKTPVFAKVAEAVKNVVDGDAKNSASALLDLTTLVNAILYTQGETGLAGPLTPIETTDLGASESQASARVIKPLLEALTTTGSGRLEVIRDAHERGAFKDLRLVKPALEAIDDVYGEIGDLIAEKVLPIYGKAILPELRAKLDLKGKAGHPRRLQLMHALDPKGTRETVKQALEGGSKEVKVVAIECLGDEKEDLPYLIEQVAAKAQDVRQAAYRALAKMNDKEAVDVIWKALSGKDAGFAEKAAQTCTSPVLVKNLIGEANDQLASLPSTKDKEQVSAKIARLMLLIRCLRGRTDKASETFLLDLFGRRAEVVKFKGDTYAHSGADLNTTVAHIIASGSKKMKAALAEAHASLNSEEFCTAFEAARGALAKEKVYDLFSPYLVGSPKETKSLQEADKKSQHLLEYLGADDDQWWWRRSDQKSLFDPRWIDAAIKLKNLSLVGSLARPDHPGAVRFLKNAFDEILKKSKGLDDCMNILCGMGNSSHPDAADAVCSALEKHGKKKCLNPWYIGHSISTLPKSAIPRLEALVPTLHEDLTDVVVDRIQQLREKE